MGDIVIEEPIFQKIVDSSTKLKAKFKDFLKEQNIELPDVAREEITNNEENY